MKQYLEKLLAREDLSLEEMQAATAAAFDDHVSESERASFLTALRAKGETPAEIAGLVKAVRAQSSQSTNAVAHVMDNCGTGGDGSHSFNISTTAAFVIAGTGVKVAKHGNRSVTSQTGSADVLEHLGVSLSFSKQHVIDMLNDNNIAFLFAPHVLPGIKRFATVRKDLAIPTIFNIIGPLTNPVALDTQLMGAYRRDMLPLLAETLKQLGRRRALIVNGAGYMDEASLAGENHLSLLENGSVRSFTLHPSDVNLPVYANEQIQGGDTSDNARILRDVLNGTPGPHLDTVLLNAGLALYANGAAPSISKGIEMANESIHSGAALKTLNRLVDYSRHAASEVM
ncbi:anthranilate phosphoribosyltransferase [Barrientosiimonas marina]|uniref:Anthranilate phosphoribosyltransferase n=1 Tax=Lentibacillus kimchii TaxID=1542911 RepID=A0ABW2UWY6_9BACI